MTAHPHRHLEPRILALIAALFLVVAAPASALNPTDPNKPPIIGPGCGSKGAFSSTGTWFSAPTGDYPDTGTPAPDDLGGQCDGTGEWARTNSGATFTYQFKLDDPTYLDACTFAVWILDGNATAHRVRYDFWWVDKQNQTHWIAWPGHEIDQAPGFGESGPYGPFGLNSGTNAVQELRITEHDDTTDTGTQMGAGDVVVSCTPGTPPSPQPPSPAPQPPSPGPPPSLAPPPSPRQRSPLPPANTSNGHPASESARLTAVLHVGRRQIRARTVRVRRSLRRVVLTGVLNTGSGRRIAGARITIEVLAGSGTHRSLLSRASAVTDGAGRYTVTVPVRRSEVIAIRYRAMSLDARYAASLWRTINVQRGK